MGFVKVALVDDVKPGEKIKLVIDGTAILLANLDGNLYALDDRCPHLGGSLSEGKIRGNQVYCPKHGAIFDIKTGKNEGSAKIAFITMKVKDAKSYPVRVEGEDILIDIG